MNRIRYKDVVPIYYHSLAPFREEFRTGLPVLTYHKLGARKHGARVKGLYLGEKLFVRQLRELRDAGFSSATLSHSFSAGTKHADRIILTFDDGFANVFERGMEPLARFGFRAMEFLVADLLGKTNEWEQKLGDVAESLMDVSQIREWLAAGHEIGSHTLTHPFLTRLSSAAAREEIGASKKKLEDQFGVPIEHFCHPFGDWNEAVRDLVVETGYKTACTTNPGVNTPGVSPFALNRLTARYPSRNLKAIWGRLRGKTR